MEYTLRQAKYTNPESEIILIGDETNNKFPFVTHVNMKDYFKSADDFAKIYKHYSTNPYNYELFCFQRWFVLKEFLENKKYEIIMVSDSDVMHYSNIANIYNTFYTKYDFCALYPFSMNIVNIAICYLKTSRIHEFTTFITLSFYDNNFHDRMKYKWLQEIKKNKVGAISDMTLITDFIHINCNNIKLASLNEVIRDSVFDNNINESSCFYLSEYKFVKGRKFLKWVNGIPYGFNNLENKFIKFNCLHLQGPAKYLTASFYTGTNFKKKINFDVKFLILNTMAYLYKMLKIRYTLASLINFLNKK